jgi:hypothetical protein
MEQKCEDKKEQEMTQCECGSLISKRGIFRHKKSIKHQYFALKTEYFALIANETFEIDNPLVSLPIQANCDIETGTV